jgi:sugar/nucleoside kinase (ribokinase family)
MHASFYFDIGAVLRGSVAVITTMKRARALFLGRSKEIWDMAETIASFGVEIVVITDGKNGQYLYVNANKKKYHLPAYPVKAIDTVCANDAFGGGFLAGYILHFDSKMATMMGNISASIKVQGSTPDYMLHTLPELAKARLASIQDQMVEC